jgi:hypothetical protein
MSSRAIDRTLYEAVIDFYRLHPGDPRGCAVAFKLDRRTANRLWKGPIPSTYPWQIPATELLDQERAARAHEKAESDALLRIAGADRAAERAKAEAEAKSQDENILRLARNDVLSGLASLARLAPGVAALSERVNDILKRGTDAQGNPLQINPVEALRVIGRYGAATRGLVEAASTLVGIERLRNDQPTAILGVQVGQVGLEEAEAEMRTAAVALARARELGLVARAPAGGWGGAEGTGSRAVDAELVDDE